MKRTGTTVTLSDLEMQVVDLFEELRAKEMPVMLAAKVALNRLRYSERTGEKGDQFIAYLSEGRCRRIGKQVRFTGVKA